MACLQTCAQRCVRQRKRRDGTREFRPVRGAQLRRGRRRCAQSAPLAHEAAAGTLNPEAIDEQLLLACLDTGGLPELDLLIRTGGEQRLSNFLPLQAA